jgi:hypothetical protein
MPNTLVRDWLQDLLHDKRHPDFRTSLACIMVVFATLGAIMAFRTASAEHDNTIRERRLAYGYFFETIERQKELNGILERALFETRLSRIYQTGLSKMETADRLRQAKPATAAWLDLQAQEEFAARRAVKPFWALTPSMQNCLSVANHLQWTVAPLLSELGFETEWQDPRPAIDLPPDSADCKFAERKEPTRSILHLLEGEIQRGHELIPKLAMSVVLFVAALVCFTLADLSTRKWYKGIWLAGGLLVGAVCLFYALQADQRSWPFLALAVGSFLLLFSVMWNVGYLSTSEEGGHQSPLLEPETRIGRYPELPHEASDSFSRFTIFAIAFTVFASALSGYWYSVAESASGEAATRALRQETVMSERSSRLRTALLSANSQSADYSEAQARHSWINQQLDASGATPLIDIEIASAGNLRGYLLGNDKLRAMMSDPEAGIEADPHFPRRLVREDPYFALKDGVLKNNAWEPFAIWDAESGESLSWHHKAAVFLFTLTLFAIALYLFGQGHSMGRRSAAYIMVGFGTLFALIGLGRGSYAQFGNEVTRHSTQQRLPMNAVLVRSDSDLSRSCRKKEPRAILPSPRCC